MPNQLSNQHLEKKIHKLTHYLPNKEELSGQKEGSSYYRKVGEQSFIHQFKKTHHQLAGLRQQYMLTEEQDGFVTKAQETLVHEIRQAFCHYDTRPHSLDEFFDD